MDNRNSWSCTFELEDIEIIDHKTENEDKLGKWHCDQCSLFFLEKGKLDEHKKKHSVHEIVKCKYCNKTISSSSVNRECYMNRKCETCEYKCSNCPQRFLRHSSLMNHEKKHSSPKKKRTINSYKKINGITAENIAVSKGLKKKQIKVGDLEEQDLEELKPKKTVNMKNSLKMKANLEVNAQTILDGEKTPIKKPRRLSLKACKSAEGKDNCEYLPVKTTKRLTLKNNKQLEENNSDAKSKQSTITFNTQTVSQTSNVSNSENVVNYKPFSCHVCGDTFASDSALLDHIRTHGENAAKSFKCKFCGDEFDDIYKMQYHLAICPLAEDELESSLKQVIPANIPTKCSGGTSSPRKRGRPKKMVESPLDREHYMNEPTPSLKRGNFRKRKSEDKESNETGQNPSGPSLPKQSKKSQNKKPLSGPDSIRVSEDSVTDYVPGDISEVTKESELDHEKKKLHQCPFPRCDFKFTREKALLCHMRNHSDDFDDSLKCHKCDIPFDDIHTLRLHINSCKGIKEERDDDFNRGDCYDSSPNRTFHRTKKDFVCNQCGRSYQNQEKLNRHLESCGSKFVCRICKDDFLNQPLLDEHFGSKHPPYTAYHCYICEEDFISELFLQIHQSDEHGQNLNSKPVQDSTRETIPIPPQRIVQESNNDADSAFARFPVKSSLVNMTPIRNSNRIHTSPVTVTVKAGRYASRIRTNSETVANSRCTIRGSRYCWCPICLVSFDKRDNMRIHFREEHVVENNSTYSCEICMVKMPLAEMMCYHLELHSSNLLSVNRFSKLIAYVKQNRVSELRSSEVEIKCEEVTEDETPSLVKESVDIANANKEKSTKTVLTQNKMVTNLTSPQQNKRYKPRDNLVGHQNSTGVDLEFLKENNLNVGSKTNIQTISNLEKNALNSVENSSIIIDNSTDKTDLIHKTQNYINLEKSTRPRRSRVRVNYSLQDKAEKGFARQIVKLNKVSNEETCVGINSLKEKSDTLVKIDYSITTKETDSVPRQGRIDRRVKQRKTLSLRKKKQNNLETDRVQQRKPLSLRMKKQNNLETDTKESERSNVDEAIYREDLIKPKTSLINDNKEIILPVDEKIPDPPTSKKNISSRKTKQLQNRNKYKQSHNSLSRNIENSNTNTEREPNEEPLREENFNNIENSATAETFSINFNNNGSKDIIYDSSIESENKNSDLNLELKDLGSQSPEVNSPEVTKGPFSEVPEEPNELETGINVQSEDSVDLPVSGITSELVAEVEYSSNENSQSGRKEPVQNSSRASTTSTVGESEGICCTMCTESFYNQDELLDHLATHI